MPPPTSSLKPAPAAKSNGKQSPTPAGAGTNGSSTPAAVEGEKHHVGKPDQAKYNAEQESINGEIATVKVKLDAVRSRISLSQAPTSSDRRTTLKQEMEVLRGEQGQNKADRGKIFDEMKRLQEGVQRKIKDVQLQRGKAGFRDVAEVDDRISTLNKQIESGTLKLIDEKKALAEITTLRRTRKTLETSTTADEAIAADKARIDELRKQLDDPEAKKASEKFDALKKEMDSLREEGNKAYEERNKLFEERNDLQAKMDELYGKKRESAQKYREENDRYYAKVQADRQARQERFKSEKAKEDAARRDEEITRLREEALLPAYAGEIEDCGVLIGWFKGKYGSAEVPSTNASGKGSALSQSKTVEGVKALEIRQVDSDFKGMQIKKKDDDESLGGFFGGSGKGKKGKNGGVAKKGLAGSQSASGTATPLSTESTSVSSTGGAVNLPMSLLSALLSFGISPPTGKEDVPRTADDLETKQAWFKANQAAKTKAEIERVEKLVVKMQKKNALLAEDDDEIADATADANEDLTAEIGGKKEPVHTVAIAGEATGKDTVEDSGLQLPTDASPNAEVKHVDSALEELKETAA